MHQIFFGHPKVLRSIAVLYFINVVDTSKYNLSQKNFYIAWNE